MRRSRSYTLVELVLALEILSILAVMAVGILTSVQRLWDDTGRIHFDS